MVIKHKQSHLISVIIPFYNEIDLIDRAVSSVFNQYTGEYKVEVIVINDGIIDNLDIYASVVAAILVLVLVGFSQYTKQGRAMRAVADDHQAALSVGVSLNFIWIMVWTLAGFVALVAGIIWGTKSGVQFSLSLIALKALPVLMLGGFTSIPGAIVGGLIIGVGEKLFEFAIGPLIGGATENWFAYVLALLFLVFRPQGLFGEKIIERV